MSIFIERGTEREQLSTEKGFKYDADSHCYTIDGTKLKNTTSWVESFKKPFEGYVIAGVVANSNRKKGIGITDADVIRKSWQLKGAHSRAVGTSFHEFCHLYWINPAEAKPKTNYDLIAIRLMDSIMEKYDILEMEQPRGNRLYMMGFTKDIVLRRRKDGMVVVGDFKTNEMATVEQYKNVKGRLPYKLSAPFDELRDICIDTASLQLNAYKILNNTLNSRTFDIDACMIIHVNPDTTYYGERGYNVYSTLDIYSKVYDILEKEKNYTMAVLDKI